MRKLSFLVAVILFSCQDNLNTGAGEMPFDLPKFAQAIVSNMGNRQADVAKSFSLNGQTEAQVFKSTDSLFWAKELAVLLKTDLNAPKYRGAFQLSTAEKDKNSNLLIDRFTAATDNIDLREIEIYYLDQTSQIRIIKLNYGSKNFIAQSRGRISLWLNEYGDQLLIDSLIATGNDKVLFQTERKYKSHLKRIRQ